jgi:hypothetical protein
MPLAGFTAAGAAVAATVGFVTGGFTGIAAMKVAGITLHSNSGEVYAQGPPFPFA